MLYLFNDGRGIRAEWQADERDALPNMPGEFIDSGFDHIDNATTEDALAEFVSEILRRVDGLSDERVDALKENWRAIRGANAEEANFCVAAGRMGVDPYDPSQMRDEVASFIETALTDPDLPPGAGSDRGCGSRFGCRAMVVGAKKHCSVETRSNPHAAADSGWQCRSITVTARLSAGSQGTEGGWTGLIRARDIRRKPGQGGFRWPIPRPPSKPRSR